MSTRSAEKNREYQAAYAARYLAEHGEWPTTAHRRKNGRKYKPSIRKTCGWCGIAHPLNDAGTTLDAEGMTHAHWLRYNGKPSESREMVRFTEVAALTATETCSQCGVEFTFVLVGITRKYCSAICGNRASWARRYTRRGKFVVTQQLRREIYEAANWRCEICHGEMSLTYTSDDPMSPTLDHIEPQAAALLPDHSRSNLRASHSICNIMRGNNRMSDQDIAARVLPMLYQAFTP